jgi:thymidylate kinase
VPDLIIMFDLPVAVALDRIRKRHGDGPNLFEKEEHLLRAQAIFDGLSGFRACIASMPPAMKRACSTS